MKGAAKPRRRSCSAGIRPAASPAVLAPVSARPARARRCATKWGLVLPPAPTVSCPSKEDVGGAVGAPALTAFRQQLRRLASRHATALSHPADAVAFATVPPLQDRFAPRLLVAGPACAHRLALLVRPPWPWLLPSPAARFPPACAERRRFGWLALQPSGRAHVRRFGQSPGCPVLWPRICEPAFRPRLLPRGLRPFVPCFAAG